jgi:hypothetical protein
MKKIAVLEFIDEFRELLEFVKNNKLELGDFLVVAIEPKLQAFLKKESVPYLDTLRFFNNESHKKMILSSERVLERIRKEFGFVDRNGLHDCYVNEYVHYLRLYLNHFFKMAEIIFNIDKAYPGAEFYASVRDRVESALMLSDRERYLGIATDRFCRKNKLGFINLHGSEEAQAGIEGKTSKPGLGQRLLASLTVLLLKKRKVIFIPYGGSYFKDLLKDIQANVSEITFVYLNGHYSFWGMLGINLVSWLKHCLFLIPYSYLCLNIGFLGKAPDASDEKGLRDILAKIPGSVDKSLWEYQGINCQDIIRKKIDSALPNHMNNMLSYSCALDHLSGSINNSMVMSYSALGLMSVAGELFKIRGKVSLFVSHAAHPEPVDNIHEVELLNLGRAFMLSDFSHIALSTPIQEKHLHYFKSKYSWVKSAEIRSGPLVFSGLTAGDRAKERSKSGLQDTDFVIVHATTTKARQGERFYFLETFDELFSSLSDLAALVNKKPGQKLVFRVHPGFFLNDQEIRSLLPATEKLIIHRQGDFSQALAMADLVVSYSSTAIDEALINKVPVLLYDKWKRYNHFRTKTFEHSNSQGVFPVCYVDDPGLLDAALGYLSKKISAAKKEGMNTDLYRYNQNYKPDFYGFIADTLEIKGKWRFKCA